jgi:hypothetical protein
MLVGVSAANWPARIVCTKAVMPINPGRPALTSEIAFFALNFIGIN